MGDINEKKYLSIKEAAEKMGYTRQYVYRALSNRFKDYLKIIDGEKKLHIDVLKLCNHANRGYKQTNDKHVTMVTNKSGLFNVVGFNKANINAACNLVNTTGEQQVDRYTDTVTNKSINKYGYKAIKAESKQVNNDGYNEENFFYETISILKQQLLMKDKQLEEKDKQLSEKDRQIKSLQDELNLQNGHARKQSDRLVGLVEQVNELQRNNQVLLAQKDISNKELEEQKENKGMFDWLFKKSNN